MQRWGKTNALTPRFFCPWCHKTAVWGRKDVLARHTRKRLAVWLTGVRSKSDIAKHYGVSRQALSKEFKSFFQKNLEPFIPSNLKIETLIVDAKYIHGNKLCVLVAITEDDRIFWKFAPMECYGGWYGFLIRFMAPRIVIADGQKGISRFIKRYWPDTALQRCHFHMVLLVTGYLSRNPREEAGKDILSLAYRLKWVKTKEEKERWLLLHRIWERRYDNLFIQKTDSGRYKYEKLRSVRLIMKRAIPNLFTYLDYPGCPNTTNLVEGWVNTAIAERMRRHRGLRLRQKKTLVSIILSNLSRNSREKPTRKFP